MNKREVWEDEVRHNVVRERGNVSQEPRQRLEVEEQLCLICSHQASSLKLLLLLLEQEIPRDQGRWIRDDLHVIRE